MIAQLNRIEAGDRVEPCDVDAEIGLLSCMMMQPAILDETESITPEMFYVSGHGMVYAAARHLWNQGVTPDLITLVSELTARKQLEAIGGKAFFIPLMDGFSATHWEEYARLIREKYTARRLVRASHQIGALAFVDSMPAAEKVNQAQQVVYELDAAEEPHHAQPAADVCISVMERLESGKSQNIMGQGFGKLFSITGGIIPGHLHVAIGETNMGKSHFGAAMAMAYAPTCPVMCLTVEMDEDEYMSRILARFSGVDSKLIQRNTLSKAEMEKVTAAMAKVSALKLHIYAASNPSDAQVRAEIRRMTRYWGEPPKLLVIDYLQYMSRGGRDRTTELDMITKEYKQIAKDFGLCSLLLSQARREVMDRKDRRPKKNDSRECGAIENHANVIYTLYRDEVARPDEDDVETGTIEVAVAKNRGGDTAEGTRAVKMNFEPRFTYFSDINF